MNARAIAGIVVMLLAAWGAQGDVLNMTTGLTSLETVPVGNPGNAGELSGASVGGTSYGHDRICGGVAYTYSIGKYEVTAGQYTEFLNAVAKTDTFGLYNPSMGSAYFGCMIQRSGTSGSYVYSIASDWANRPVNYVSWADAARFTNWLQNGQPTGLQDVNTTEDGAYFLNGATTRDALQAVTRKPGWKWAIPTEDEWYKAAYYNPIKRSYNDYATGSNSLPSNVLGSPTDRGNNATFYDSTVNPQDTIGAPYYRTEVGAHENSESPYGTFDQSGNVFELNETIIVNETYSFRGLRGGSAYHRDTAMLASDRGFLAVPTDANAYAVGFRVVSSEIPEPATLSLLALGGLVLARRRRIA